MKRLLTAFKNLPPEMRMVLALAGLASPIGALYLLQRIWKTLFGYTPPTLYLILGLAAVIAVISVIGFLFSRVIGRGKIKRSRRMANELASGSESGPVSMDLRAAVKSNNEKFFTAIRTMRKNLGISVYDLPWYIVIGDSGCGKTKLINEGGLTFSTGKPEGYQLGTLNYNWWFTEDAVFIDMAGRLCNPQDDADRREWAAMLDTVAKGRKGYPINGALVCVSAEHLLQDSPEKHEQDANTALERLRDLQTKLGVTFATYLVVTKCDKILGFMQFFDRAERDITVKNQIFGWSKPGTFDELYNPEVFNNDYDSMYERLHELRLRRLNDDVDEIELGLAYSFPEEFRELNAPLQTYVRTLFPMIKNPRAVKNLVFRGIYFTSATQQGAVILKHLTERLGAQAADQFPPLESLYPQPRPHFVKDLLFRKVFPEHGLVFRNEQQVVRNRKLSKLLKVGSVALALVLITVFSWSLWAFSNLIGIPRAHASNAPQQRVAPPQALERALKVHDDRDNLIARPWPARVLSLGIGADEPIRHLTTIEVHLFQDGVLKPALRDVDQVLREGKLDDPRKGDDAIKAAGAYMDALKQYVTWYGSAAKDEPPDYINLDGFKELCRIVKSGPNTDSVIRRDGFDKQAASYFETIRSGEGWKNPAKILAESGVNPPDTIQKAIETVHNYMGVFATLSPTHPDIIIREWSRLHEQCSTMMKSYAAMLAASQATITTEQELDAFRGTFQKEYTGFSGAWDGCNWKAQKTGRWVRITALREALKKQRELWTSYADKLGKSYELGGKKPADDAVAHSIKTLTTGDAPTIVRGLDRVLCESLLKNGLADKDYYEGFFGDDLPQRVTEVDVRFGHIFNVSKVPETAADDDKLQFTPNAVTVREFLARVNEKLAGSAAGAPGSREETPAVWIRELTDRFAEEEAESQPATLDFSKLAAAWEPPKLQALYEKYGELIKRGEATALLTRIDRRLAQAGPWGFGELESTYRELAKSTYSIAPPPAREAEPIKYAITTREVKPEKPTRRRRTAASPFGDTAAPTVVQPVVMPTVAGASGVIPRVTTQEFLAGRAIECFQLLDLLRDFTPDYYFQAAGEAVPHNTRCIEQIKERWTTYSKTYVDAWKNAYKAYALTDVDKLAKWNQGWQPFAAQFTRAGAATGVDARNVAAQLRNALEEVLRVTRWAPYDVQHGYWEGSALNEMKQVALAVSGALRESWGNGSFAAVGQVPGDLLDKTKQPWTQLAELFEQKFIGVYTAIGKNAELPTDFSPGAAEVTLPPIPWGAIDKLREDARLTDEKLTGQLVQFEKNAQDVLSAELSQRLFAIQDASFRGKAFFDGWPYLTGGPGLDALETVDFEQFSKFLRAVEKAERTFAPLEAGLRSDDALQRRRREFYQACKSWREFMGLDPNGQPSDLRVEVWNSDPLVGPRGNVAIDDTAQKYYKKVGLSLGLSIDVATTPGGKVEAILLKTTEKGESHAIPAHWKWTAPPNTAAFSMELIDGITAEGASAPFPVIEKLVLGKVTPLAFPAYLHRYASSDGQGNWTTVHVINLEEQFRKAGRGDMVPKDGKKLVGERFIFKLARPLPKPILPFEKPATTTGSG